jgi:hypothetical protein
VPWAKFRTRIEHEFYDIRKTGANPTGLDLAQLDLLKNCPEGQDPETCLPQALRSTYAALNDELSTIKQSGAAQASCRSKGDGNLDLRVTAADLRGWEVFNGRGPSVYDINLDGVTDRKDRRIIEANLGLDCLDMCVRADLNRDGVVNASDIQLLTRQKGACKDDIFCGGDLNGDSRVNAADVAVMRQAKKTCPSPKREAAKGPNREGNRKELVSR